MFELRIGYPSREEEERIVTRRPGDTRSRSSRCCTAPKLIELQQLVRRMPAPPTIVKYAVQLARSTRPTEPERRPGREEVRRAGAPARARRSISCSAPRRARRWTAAPVPDLDDVRAMAMPVLRHRVVMNFQAEAEGMGAEHLVAQVLKR